MRNLIWRLTWQQVDNISWSTGYRIGPIKKQWVQRHKTKGGGNQSNCHWLLVVLFCHNGTRALTYVAVLQHDPFYFTLSSRAHQLQNWISMSHWHMIWKGAWVYGHGSWSTCEAKLNTRSNIEVFGCANGRSIILS